MDYQVQKNPYLDQNRYAGIEVHMIGPLSWLVCVFKLERINRKSLHSLVDKSFFPLPIGRSRPGAAGFLVEKKLRYSTQQMNCFQYYERHLWDYPNIPSPSRQHKIGTSPSFQDYIHFLIFFHFPQSSNSSKSSLNLFIGED